MLHLWQAHSPTPLMFARHAVSAVVGQTVGYPAAGAAAAATPPVRRGLFEYALASPRRLAPQEAYGATRPVAVFSPRHVTAVNGACRFQQVPTVTPPKHAPSTPLADGTGASGARHAPVACRCRFLFKLSTSASAVVQDPGATSASADTSYATGATSPSSCTRSRRGAEPAGSWVLVSVLRRDLGWCPVSRIMPSLRTQLQVGCLHLRCQELLGACVCSFPCLCVVECPCPLLDDLSTAKEAVPTAPCGWHRLGETTTV